jgi:IS30 family transposase
MNYSHLTTEERYTIEKLNSRGESIRAIAEALERAPSTISRELQRYGKRKVYSARKASRKAKKRRKNCSNGIRVSVAVKHYIRSKLKLLWSPEQIAGTLRLHKKGLRLQLVSARWIYSFIRSDKKSGGDLYTYLRCQKKRRKRYGTGLNKRGTIPGRIDISKRPAAANKRRRIGDWEGDLIMGAGHHQAIVSLVDRKTRYTLLKKIPTKQAKVTERAIITMLKKFPRKSRTLTLDNGKEFARHRVIKKALGIDVYFARPYASYERGTNENTNGLIRQRFPKQKSFATITQIDLNRFQKLLNHRPRKSLNFLTPHEMLIRSIK